MPAVRRFLPAVALVALGALAACSKKVPAPDAPAPAAVHTGAPLTDDDYRKFGKELERAAAAGDRETVKRLLRLSDMVARSVSDFPLSASERTSLLAGAANGAESIVGQLITEAKTAGHYKFLRARESAGKRVAIMRLLNAEGGVNYHEVSLIRYADGQVGAEDLYVHATGETLTQTYRRVVLPGLAEAKRGLLDRLNGSDRLFTKNLPTIQSAMQEVRAGQHASALARLRGLPAELRDQKIFALIAVQAAQGCDEAEYLKELERLRKLFPNDPTVELVLLDYYALKRQFDEAIRVIDRLNAAVGGDPHLVATRALMLGEAGRAAEAKTEAERAIAEEPTHEFCYSVRVGLALKQKNFADALAWLKKGVEVGAVDTDTDGLLAAPDYAEFVKSPQFAEFGKWLAERGKK
jgi:tetratricopeptide (TPR) repeat protein